jgi:hypothetical protein
MVDGAWPETTISLPARSFQDTGRTGAWPHGRARRGPRVTQGCHPQLPLAVKMFRKIQQSFKILGVRLESAVLFPVAVVRQVLKVFAAVFAIPGLYFRSKYQRRFVQVHAIPIRALRLLRCECVLPRTVHLPADGRRVQGTVRRVRERGHAHGTVGHHTWNAPQPLWRPRRAEHKGLDRKNLQHIANNQLRRGCRGRQAHAPQASVGKERGFGQSVSGCGGDRRGTHDVGPSEG